MVASHEPESPRPSERLDSAWFGSGDALNEKAWLLAEQRIQASGNIK